MNDVVVEMEIITVILIGLGLSMDSFAVSMSCAISHENPRFKEWLLVALPFTLIQPLFTLAGWFAGSGMRNFMSDYDHWVAFLLLMIIGCKMIREAFGRGSKESKILQLKPTLLLVLAAVTSIDAFAVGIGLGFIKAPLTLALVIIGGVTFLMVMTGGFVGKNFARFFRSYAEALGGGILILIAFKILIEHLLENI